MLLNDNVKKGFAVLLVYSLVTICLFMATERIERLEVHSDDFRNTNTSVSLNFSK